MSLDLFILTPLINLEDRELCKFPQQGDKGITIGNVIGDKGETVQEGDDAMEVSIPL